MPAEPESVHDNQDEAAVRAHVQGSMEVQRLVTHLKQIEARAKAGAADGSASLCELSRRYPETVARGKRVSTVIYACGLTQSNVPYGGRRNPGVGGLSL